MKRKQGLDEINAPAGNEAGDPNDTITCIFLPEPTIDELLTRTGVVERSGTHFDDGLLIEAGGGSEPPAEELIAPEVLFPKKEGGKD